MLITLGSLEVREGTPVGSVLLCRQMYSPCGFPQPKTPALLLTSGCPATCLGANFCIKKIKIKILGIQIEK